jgi:hypothetical protein
MSAQSDHAARSAIRPVKESAEDDLIARDGVVAVDIAEKITDGQPTGQLSIVVFVEKKKPESRLSKAQAIPKEINGVPTDVQELTVELFSAVRYEEVSTLVDASAYTTLSGGIGIGPARTVFLSPPDVPSAGNYVFVGTLGALVKDRSSGSTMALTNFHVACVNNSWTVGDRQVQPSRVDGGSATTGQFGSLTRATLSENVDGSVITLDAGKAWTPTVVDIGGVAGKGLASVGMAVQKRGRTTEHTYGNVVSTDFTVSIDYGSDVGTHTLRHQIRIDTDTTKSPRFSDHGDSGSVVMDGSRNVVGLLYGGSNDGVMTFANPIQAVLDELSVDLLVDKPTLVTKPAVCNFLTRPSVCSLKSRVIVCNIVSRYVICNLVTRPVLCDLVTKPVICDQIVTRPGCPPDGPGDPRGPVEFPIPNQIPGLSGAEQDWYGSMGPALDDTFVAGYLAALEAVAAEEERQGQ